MFEIWKLEEGGTGLRLGTVSDDKDAALIEEAIRDLISEFNGREGRAVEISAIDFEKYERYVKQGAPPLDHNDLHRRFPNSLAASKYIGAPGNQVSNAMRKSTDASFEVRGVTFFRIKK